MSNALEYHKGSASSGGWIFVCFLFAYDIVVNAEEIEKNELLPVWIQYSHGARWRLRLTNRKE